MRLFTRAIMLAALTAYARGQVTFGSISPSPPNNDPPGSLSGRVVNAVTGQGVRGAAVSLQNYSRGGNIESVTTDASGAFSSGNLPPGNYFVQVSHPNFQGILGFPSPSVMAALASNKESSGVTLRLIPGGTISGKVLDDGAEPVAGCQIWALGPGQTGGSAEYSIRGNATTNDKGEYKFEALTADRYLVYARCQDSLPVERPLAVWRPELINPAESWLPVFYPDNSSPEGAQRLAVLPGSEFTGIDFRLRPTPVATVSGKLVGTGDAEPSIQLSATGAGLDSSLGYPAPFDRADSTFRIQMVPPGSYHLTVISNPGQTESLAYASIPLIVGKAAPAPLLIQMRPGITITGTVESPPAEGAGREFSAAVNASQNVGRQTPKEPPRGYVTLIPVSMTAFSTVRQAEVRQDGSFTVHGLTPGRYRVVIRISSPQPLSIESVQYGSTALEHSVIDVAEGAVGTLRVRASGSPPQVTASLADAPTITRGDSRGDWMIIALSADEPLGQFQQPVSGIGRSGDTVRLQNISAGKFAFVAIELTLTGGIQNDRLNQFLRERTEAVEIASGREQTVSPRFFTSQEIEKLALSYIQGDSH